MRKIFTGIAGLALLSLTACGLDSPTAGTVVDKNFKESWSEEVEITEEQCTGGYDTVGTGKSKRKVWDPDDDCTDVGTGEFETVEHPAEYELIFEDKEGERGSAQVDEATFNEFEVGEFFDSEAE